LLTTSWEVICGRIVAVRHLEPLLQRPKEVCQAMRLGRMRNGQDGGEGYSRANGKYRVQHRSSMTSETLVHTLILGWINDR
jgi:hypothetical protein